MKYGFTLIELLVIIVIIALLAFVALRQYSWYRKQAKAKELINLAQGCVMELVSKCEVGGKSSINKSEVESCQTTNATYIRNIVISLTGNPVNCGHSFNATATGNLVGGGNASVTCGYDAANRRIFCLTPMVL